jgi:hypothetical protein
MVRSAVYSSVICLAAASLRQLGGAADHALHVERLGAATMGTRAA